MKVVTKKYMKAWFVTSLVLCIALALVVRAGSSNDVSRPPCSDCHLCNAPTIEEPCLKNCMRSTGVIYSSHNTKKGSDVILLGGHGNLYEPVRFNHQIHANMGGMNGGCKNCHHYSPKGKFPPCRDCHTQPQKMGQPGLKGAFHRQCMGCHQTWSHTTDCAYCHVPLGSPSGVSLISGSAISDIAQHSIVKPDKRVYYTSYAKGEKVTFYHNEHVDLFGLECADCHQKESCGYCHDRSATVASKKTGEEIHAICMDCHQGDKCNKCHGDKEKPPFQHDPDHWSLGGYHRQLDCASCHPPGKRISQMNADCNHCHQAWDSQNFVHAVTGLKLDDIHVDLDCGDCHLDRRFHDSPDCTGCHDDGRTPQTNPPGTRLNLTALGGLSDEAEETY